MTRAPSAASCAGPCALISSAGRCLHWAPASPPRSLQHHAALVSPYEVLHNSSMPLESREFDFGSCDPGLSTCKPCITGDRSEGERHHPPGRPTSSAGGGSSCCISGLSIDICRLLSAPATAHHAAFVWTWSMTPPIPNNNLVRCERKGNSFDTWLPCLVSPRLAW